MNRDLFAQVGPDALGQLDEVGVVAHLGHHARARQVDRVDALQGGRARRQHEHAVGQGDGLFLPMGASKPMRVQGAWVTDSEVNKITDYLRLQSPPQYNEDIISQPVTISSKGGLAIGGDLSDSTDETFKDAVRVVMEAKKASTSLLQRRLRIGYGRASRLIDEMEDKGIVGPPNGSKPRDILISSLEDVE